MTQPRCDRCGLNFEEKFVHVKATESSKFDSDGYFCMVCVEDFLTGLFEIKIREKTFKKL